MEDECKKFEQLLVDFEREHARRTRTLHAHMTKVKELLESETDGLQQTMEVRHAPISARLKDGDKALRTLRRRQEERKSLQNLKNLVNQRNHDWDEYCKEWNMEDKKHEAEPFTSTDQMFKAMHDLAGIRVSVYFPTDVEKVVEFLRGEQFRIVQEPSRKGGLSRDFQKVRKLVERQRRIHEAPEEERDEIERKERMSSGPESTFGGYKATHVVIRLRNHEFDKLSRGDDITDIEVQIGTIVMHAWSDIEHDILYKPTDHNKASKDVVQMLDLINGIVMTGEVALKQLASVAAAEAKRKAASRIETADNWHHVVPWFYAYFKEKRNVEVTSEISWSSAPRYLFEILKATNDHNYGRVEALLDDLKPVPEPEERLPWRLLHSLGSDAFDEPTIGPVEFPYTWKVRYWATCLVNVINMSFYLDSNPMTSMGRAYDAEPSDNSKRPTFAEFLDILHPTHPQRRPHREDGMIDFCKKVLATEFDGRAFACKIAARLTAAGYVVRPPLSTEEEKNLDVPTPIFVPAMLKYVTKDRDTIFRIALSIVDEDASFDRYNYFIPSRDTNTWRPVRRDSEKKTWFITKNYPFTYDPSLPFVVSKGQGRSQVGHLCSTLGVTTDSNEIRTLADLATTLKIKHKPKIVRRLKRLTTALGTMDAGRVAEFMKISDRIDVYGAYELTERATLARVLDIKSLDELEEYCQLARAHDTLEADRLIELRRLKSLADGLDTKEPERLKESRGEEKKDEEGFHQHQGRRYGDFLRPSELSLSNSRNGDTADSLSDGNSCYYSSDSDIV